VRDQAIDWEVSNIASSLSRYEKMVLLQLREDGRGNYDPSLTKARKSLCAKGLADSPMALGFGGRFYACVQKPTELGERVQRYFGSAS
jgi:hypothetical protein